MRDTSGERESTNVSRAKTPNQPGATDGTLSRASPRMFGAQRASTHLPPAALIRLQRTVGNRGTSAFLTSEPDQRDPKPPRQRGDEPTRRSGATPVAVSRKVGFEFESDSGRQFLGKSGNREPKPISTTKKMLLKFSSGLGGLSADNGKVEFKTAPLRSITQVEEAINEFLQYARMRPDELTGLLNDARLNRLTGFDKHFIAGEGTFRGKPQATIGIRAERVNDFFERLIVLRGSEEGKGVAGDLKMDAIEHFRGSGRKIVRQALGKVFQGVPTNPDPVPQMAGILSLVLNTIHDAHHYSPVSDPKYAFPIMHRTDFRTMVTALDDFPRALFNDLWNGGLLQAEFATLEIPLDEPLFTGGYGVPGALGGRREKGPTRREWMASVFAGGGDKDLLSPPPGYPSHASTPEPEGMGAMGADPVDPRLLLLELREFGPGGYIQAGDLPALALRLTRIVGEIDHTSVTL